MRKFSKRLFCVIIIIGFLLVLYWVEGSNWSSQAVGKYNGGYGTFDMKTYNIHVVEKVLGNMCPEGYKISYRYYVGDYLFIVFFGLVQCMISRTIYNSLKQKKQVVNTIFTLSIVITIFRGIADFIENTILIYTLIRYPMINKAMIEVATIATQIKLVCIKLWELLVIIGIVMVIIKYKGVVHKKKLKGTVFYEEKRKKY